MYPGVHGRTEIGGGRPEFAQDHVILHVLKTNSSKFTRGLEPLYGDACSAKSLEVLTLVFSIDCSPIVWVQSVLKITRFENVFLFFSFLKIRRHVRGGVKLD